MRRAAILLSLAAACAAPPAAEPAEPPAGAPPIDGGDAGIEAALDAGIEAAPDAAIDAGAGAGAGADAGAPIDLPQDRELATELAPNVTLGDLLRRFAPVWYHATATGGPDGEGPRGDFYMTFDFDGDLRHDNNWDHLPGAELSASIYYAFRATDTHYYFTFSQYHARDWASVCFGFGECHEGDMESIHFAVERDATGYGTPIAYVTSAHGRDFIWSDDASAFGEEVLGPVDYESDDGEYSATFDAEHSHVRIFTQTGGHGPIPCRAREDEPFGGYFGFPPRTIDCGAAFDGILFRYTEGAATSYFDGIERSDYRLLGYLEHVWPHRFELGTGRLFSDEPDQMVQYTGARGRPPFALAEPIGARFATDQFLVDSSGIAAWKTELEASNKGDLFFDPAYAFTARFGVAPELSADYVYHPYLGNEPR